MNINLLQISGEEGVSVGPDGAQRAAKPYYSLDGRLRGRRCGLDRRDARRAKRQLLLKAMVLVVVALLGAALAWYADDLWQTMERIRNLWGPQDVVSSAEVQESVGDDGSEGALPEAAPEDASVIAAITPRELPTPTSWDEEGSPDYWRLVGPAIVDLEIPAGEIWYQPLDDLGRATRVAGTIDYATMRAGIARERGDLRNLEPSGWGHNEEAEIVQPNGNEYHGYFWNRSHLVAKSLGGSDELENLVCGTRMQNVGANDGRGGMGYPESLARSWLEAHPEGTIYYSVAPLYEGDEAVCRSVLVDIRSSDGELDLELEVYNAAKGFAIDYATGTFAPTAS